MEAKGITIRRSSITVVAIMDRIQKLVLQRGATVYLRVNQQKEVINSGGKLLPLEFIQFGNPLRGGPLMEQNPLVALELPLKIIAWEDDKHDVWIAYTSGSYIEERYSLPHEYALPLYLDELLDLALMTDCEKQ
jgi:uncharacterized protein (DUF302 family)